MERSVIVRSLVMLIKALGVEVEIIQILTHQK
jgi:hypothetical protein